MPRSDDFLKKIADEYVERYGQELQKEADELEKTPGVTVSELRVEKRVRKRIAVNKRRRHMPVIATLAACFVIAFIFIIPILFGGDIGFEPAPAPAPPAAEAPAPAPEAPTLEPLPPPAPEAPAPAPEPPPMDAVPDDEPPPYEIIPLAAPLPEGFTQVGFYQDGLMSIYFIEDLFMNEIVIILERAELPSDLADMEEIDIDGLVAFGRQTDTYSKLIFVLDDVLYTLTTELDFDVLIYLANAFV